MTVRSYRYGAHPAQVCDLYLPGPPPGSAGAGGSNGAGGARGLPGVAVLVHGGYWRARYDRSLQADVAADLVARGWAVWNVDYRGVGAGGGWPATFEDLAAGVDLLSDVAPGHGLPLEAVVAIGHSAGGTLALWATQRGRLPQGAPGARPRVLPRAVVAQAAICDLAAGARAGLGDGAVLDLLGCPPPQDAGGPPDGDLVADPYALASPAALVPVGVPVLLVTGADDDTVPAAQSEQFAQVAATAGDEVTLVVVPGEGHYGHLEPSSPLWQVTVDWLTRPLESP